MAMIVPLPESVRAFLHRNTHPGLALDKYVTSCEKELLQDIETRDFGDQSAERDRRGRKSDEEKKASASAKLSERVQKPTILELVKLTNTEPSHLNYAILFNRWQRLLSSCRATTFAARTVSPLTLHLARASALENAGICLHPIYGFVYLPGTGLKGMARAYAETVWLPTQEDKEKAWIDIEDVFGWGPNKDREDQIKDSNHPAHRRREKPQDQQSPEIKASTGQIVFFDAWPRKWTPLEIDILNNHHPSYYQDQKPPGDWDSPIPVYFLAIQAGHEFQFAVAKRRDDVDERLLDLAVQWLIGALEYEGAGAKTATGYGAFKVTELPQRITRDAIENTWNTAIKKKRRAEFSCTLELVTPAFLAGPLQQAADCDLRPATLRGLLRWWWRTMHAGHVDAKTLARLEAAVWGDTNCGGAVRLIVESAGHVNIALYDKEQIARHNLNLPTSGNLDKATIPGLYYFTFGMDDYRKEKGHRCRYQRYYVIPGEKWEITLVARSSVFELINKEGKVAARKEINAPEVLIDQARAALWLLCYFGGVGSKSRKGFGCFDIPVELRNWTVEQCKKIAEEFRNYCGVRASHGCGSPSLESAIIGDEVPAQLKNIWVVLDSIGTVAQHCAKQIQPKAHRLALGLPRNIKGPGSFNLGSHVKKTNRHASPIIYHVGRQNQGYVVRCVAFPSPELPDDATSKQSRDILKRALECVVENLKRRLGSSSLTALGNQGPKFPQPQPSDQVLRSSATATPAPPLKAHDVVEVTIVEDPGGKNRLYGKHEATGLVGRILDPKGIITSRELGTKVRVKVASVSSNNKQIQFTAIEPHNSK